MNRLSKAQKRFAASSVLILCSLANPAHANTISPQPALEELKSSAVTFDLRENLASGSVSATFDDQLARLQPVDDTATMAPQLAAVAPTITDADNSSGSSHTEKITKYGPEDPQKPALPPEPPKYFIDKGKKGWSSTLTGMAVGYAILSTIDTKQTMVCMDRIHCSEKNPFLGSQPSKGKIAAFQIVSLAAIIGITKLISNSSRDLAKIFLGVVNAGTAAVVYENDRQLRINKRKYYKD